MSAMTATRKNITNITIEVLPMVIAETRLSDSHITVNFPFNKFLDVSKRPNT